MLLLNSRVAQGMGEDHDAVPRRATVRDEDLRRAATRRTRRFEQVFIDHDQQWIAERMSVLLGASA